MRKQGQRVFLGLLLAAAGCGASGSPSGGGPGASSGPVTFTLDGVAQQFTGYSANIAKSSTTAQNGSPLNGTVITATSSGQPAASLTLEIPQWPPAAGSWSCPSGWEVGVIYTPSNGSPFYAGQNGAVNPNAATAPCSIVVTSASGTIKGTFSATVGNHSGTSHSIQNGTFSIPLPAGG